MASSTAHSRLANSQRVLGCSAGSACRSEAGMPGSCSYTPKHRAAVLLLWGRLREHAPGRAPRSRPSQAAGLQTDKHVRPKRKSGCATHAEAGRRAGPEDVEHGEHVELHEADEAARRLDRDGLNLAHLDAEYFSKSPQISPISRGLEEARGVQQRRRAQKCRERGREREREAEKCGTARGRSRLISADLGESRRISATLAHQPQVAADEARGVERGRAEQHTLPLPLPRGGAVPLPAAALPAAALPAAALPAASRAVVSALADGRASPRLRRPALVDAVEEVCSGGVPSSKELRSLPSAAAARAAAVGARRRGGRRREEKHRAALQRRLCVRRAELAQGRESPA